MIFDLQRVRSRDGRNQLASSSTVGPEQVTIHRVTSLLHALASNGSGGVVSPKAYVNVAQLTAFDTELCGRPHVI